MHAISKGLNVLVLRPVLTMDKNEIINTAKDIGTYDLSIQPYFECCTYLVPKHPTVKANHVVIDRLAEEVGGIEPYLSEVEEINYR